MRDQALVLPPPPPPQQQQPRGPGDFIAGSQGLTIYGRLVAAMENSIVNLIAKNPGRQLSLGMLGPDHEISVLVRQTLEVTQKIAPSERDNTAFQFAYSIFFKRVREADERLRMEAYVGILGGLRDECKRLSKEILNWINYLAIEDDANRTKTCRILTLLMRVKICRVQDLDLHIAVKMNAGQSGPWVDFAMVFLHECLTTRKIAQQS